MSPEYDGAWWQLCWSEKLPTNRGVFRYEGVMPDDGSDVVTGRVSKRSDCLIHELTNCDWDSFIGV